eukprot:TRINITY_DN2171_c0_g1_i1.p1 TRINITY_DN2171_c0_g1~~TRINITY_DN2171_c0_g1_i1.p1  ORF type:complete len:746 (+),score=143.81 TRINITY_DN2171_c0_g1_i1:185-2422(+)
MAIRKMWRVYQRGLENWIRGLLQPVFDGVVNVERGPQWLYRLKIAEFTLDHEAPTLSAVRRRSTRKDSEVNAVCDLRYTGGARMLLILNLGKGDEDGWKFKLPVLVSDLDLECQLWMKITLAPMCPWVGTISLAFVSPPKLRVQLSPYNRVRLMRIPVLQSYLRQLLTVDLPQFMVLPRRLEIIIPPAVTAVAEAAVGREAVMRAVASAVLQADAVEHALQGVLPLGRQADAGGIILPEMFSGELKVTLKGGRNLPVWGLPWQTNPWCRLMLGSQAVNSRKENETSAEGQYGAPIWNQEFEFLVEDVDSQVLEIYIKDSPMTGKPEVGKVTYPLRELPPSGECNLRLQVIPSYPSKDYRGELFLNIVYKPFQEDILPDISEVVGKGSKQQEQDGREVIKDVKSLAEASSKATVAASAAATAVAVTRAAAARAAAKAAVLQSFASQLGEGNDSEIKSTSSLEDIRFERDLAQKVKSIQHQAQGGDGHVGQQQNEQSQRQFVPEEGEEFWDGMAVSTVVTPALEEYQDENPYRTEMVSNALDRKVIVRNTNMIKDDLEVLKSVVDSMDMQDIEDGLNNQFGNGSPPPQSPAAIIPVPPGPKRALQTGKTGQKASHQKSLGKQQEEGDEEDVDREGWKFWGLLPLLLRKGRKLTKVEKPKPTMKVIRQASGPVEEVIIPPDLPLEEIAKEVARVREEAIQSEKTRAESFWAQALEQADRPWIILLVSLTAGALILLMVVFYRLDMLQG